MKNILVLLAHPKFELSSANKSLIHSIKDLPFVQINDLYEKYPDFNIQVEKEKADLLKADIIIWHHPIYWYSCPPLLKQWIDLVLEFGWAYGPNGTALKNKIIFNSITSGGAEEAYQKEGRNRFTLHEFLSPFNQTAHLCNLVYLPPFAVQGTHRISNEELNFQAKNYRKMLELLSSEAVNIQDLQSLSTLNKYF